MLKLKLFNTLATLCEELTRWKRPWCWEGLGAGGEGDNRVWDGWMASPTQWAWVWVNSGSLWWTWRPGVLWFMGSQRVGHNWATELELESMQWLIFKVVSYFHREGSSLHRWSRAFTRWDGSVIHSLGQQLWGRNNQSKQSWRKKQWELIRTGCCHFSNPIHWQEKFSQLLTVRQ